MNKSNLLLVIGVVAVMSACSNGEQAQAQNQAQSQEEAQQAPAMQQSLQQSSQQSPHPAQPASPAATSDRYQLPKNGKVTKVMHAGGYTYMQLENDGKEFWIAATMMKVKRDDYVRWADAAVMKNFTSSTLHKTFDEILFVTNAELDQ